MHVSWSVYSKCVWVYGYRMMKLQLLRKNPHQKVKLRVLQLPVSHHRHHQQNCWTGALRWLVATRALNWPTGQHHGAMVLHFVPLSIISGQTWCESSFYCSLLPRHVDFLPNAAYCYLWYCPAYILWYLYLHILLICTVMVAAVLTHRIYIDCALCICV